VKIVWSKATARVRRLRKRRKITSAFACLSKSESTQEFIDGALARLRGYDTFSIVTFIKSQATGLKSQV
jgi:hypothetical protein